MITVYGIANCDTCRKARRWLDDRGADYRFHDFRKDGLERATVAAWLGELGPDVLVNRRGTTWRQLPEDDRAKLESNAADLLVAHPTLIKRPVIDLGNTRQVGFAAAQVTALEATLSG